jgi:hypothetical protein
MSPSTQTHRSPNGQKLRVGRTDEQAASVIAQIARPDEIAHLAQHVADAGERIIRMVEAQSLDPRCGSTGLLMRQSRK